MKVLLVHQAFPPEASGGSELYTEALARALARRHEVALLHRSSEGVRPDHDLRETLRAPIRVFSLNNREQGLGFEAYRDEKATAFAAGVLDELQPDVVHVGNLTGLSTGIVFEARRRGAAVVMTLHDFGTVCPLGQLLNLHLEVCPGPTPRRCLGCVGEQVSLPATAALPFGRGARGVAGVSGIRLASRAARRVSRLLGRGRSRVAERLAEMHEVLRAADVLVSPSRFLAARMAALGAPPIEVLEHGLEPREPLPRTADPQSRVRFGFVGSAIPSKGVHVLAQAFRLLNDPRAALRIHGGFAPYHGDTGYESRVRQTLGPLASEALLGPFPHDRLPEVLAGLDVLVVPSIWEENAPLVLMEAFRARLPVVVSDHGGLAERVRDGVDGLRFPPADPQDLRRVLRRLLDEPALRQRLGSCPPAVPTMDEHVLALEEVYARARRRVGERAGRVGVVVVDHGLPEETAEAARSAQEPTLSPSIVVVENGPGPEPSLPSGATVVRLAENRGYAAGINAGLAQLARSGCDRFLLLNNDALLEHGCLRRLAEALEDPQLAAVSPMVLRRADGRVESRGARFDPRFARARLAGHGERAVRREGRTEVESLSGAVWMMSRAAYERVGPLEESFFFSFEETDWCLRARSAGFRLDVVLGARAAHWGSRTLGQGSAARLYYAARNHLYAAERNRPLNGAGRWGRRLVILALNLGHALAQSQVPRTAGARAALRGVLDSWKGRLGPRGGDA